MTRHSHPYTRPLCRFLHRQYHWVPTAPQAFFPARMVPQAVELRVLVGHACERMLETTVHDKVALLVLGTHGCTGLAHLSMGRVTARVVRLAPRPVWTVQTPTTEDTGT